MCGIFGLLINNSENINYELIKNFFNYGKKRGPENSIIKYVNEDIIFGFHRLAINGLNEISNQPIVDKNNKYILICNGEIYNYKELYNRFNFNNITNSDCEIIIHMYDLLGLNFINFLDGVFSFILYDINSDKIVIGRDPHGVRPLYFCNYENGNISFCSDLLPLLHDKNIKHISQFLPGTISVYKKETNVFNKIHHERYFYLDCNIIKSDNLPIEYYMYNYIKLLEKSIKKRVENCERPIACLLSGGLDSSIISAYVKRFYNNTLETYSIGLKDAEDLFYADIVSKHINSKHKSVIFNNEDFINSIPDVIKDIESYDTTTVRASVGNWNIGKYIKKNSDVKVIFNGDGADELMGGYIYFNCAPNNEEFHNETMRLLKDISKFDVIRSDKSISSHGLEPRTPFLDKNLTKYYLSIPIEYRNHNNDNNCEKYFIRKAIELYDSELLPSEVLWRTKEAFSDGVSSKKKSWFEIIQESDVILNVNENFSNNIHNQPLTKEQMYYRSIFNKLYPKCDKLIPYFWMPKFIKNAHDSSARTLNIYK